MKSLKHRMPLFAAVFLGFLALARPGESIVHISMPIRPTLPTSSGQTSYIQVPGNSINFSQLQQILNQYQGLNQLDFQFPNQYNWATNPSSLQGLLGNIQQAAESMGVSGDSLSNLALSSLTDGNGLGQDQISIPSLLQGGGNIQAQLDNVMHQLRYEQLKLSEYLPDWLKNGIVTVYDTVYAMFDFIQTQIVGLLLPLFS